MKGKEILPLEKADLSLLYSTGWREPQKIAVKSADGITDLYGVMYTPFDMDSTRKYPLVVYVYPGPQEDQVPQAFSMDDNGNQALAQLGLIVITQRAFVQITWSLQIEKIKVESFSCSWYLKVIWFSYRIPGRFYVPGKNL